MHITIQKEVFLKALSKVQGIVEKRNTIPILSNVLISTTNDGINISATDLEVGMTSCYEAEILKNGSITVSARKLHEIIKELPEQKISFITKDNSWVEIKCEKAKFNIVGLPPDEFPLMPKKDDLETIVLESNDLREMIDKTFFSTSNDESKYNLNGIYLKLIKKENITCLRLVATDGHRLSMIENEIKNSELSDLKKGVILPKKGISELKKLLDDNDKIEMSFKENNAIIKQNKTMMFVRLIDGEFPDYERVIPKSNENIATIKKDDLLHCLKRISILSNEKSKGVKLLVKNNIIEISSSNPDFGDASENITIEYSGPEIQMGFNAKYLIDILMSQNCEYIELLLKDNLSPGLIKNKNNDNYLAVVMPMRL